MSVKNEAGSPQNQIFKKAISPPDKIFLSMKPTNSVPNKLSIINSGKPKIKSTVAKPQIPVMTIKNKIRSCGFIETLYQCDYSVYRFEITFN